MDATDQRAVALAQGGDAAGVGPLHVVQRRIHGSGCHNKPPLFTPSVRSLQFLDYRWHFRPFPNLDNKQRLRLPVVITHQWWTSDALISGSTASRVRGPWLAFGARAAALWNNDSLQCSMIWNMFAASSMKPTSSCWTSHQISWNLRVAL